MPLDQPIGDCDPENKQPAIDIAHSVRLLEYVATPRYYGATPYASLATPGLVIDCDCIFWFFRRNVDRLMALYRRAVSLRALASMFWKLIVVFTILAGILAISGHWPIDLIPPA